MIAVRPIIGKLCLLGVLSRFPAPCRDQRALGLSSSAWWLAKKPIDVPRGGGMSTEACASTSSSCGPRLSDLVDVPLGTTITSSGSGSYVVEACIGAGYFAKVYSARRVGPAPGAGGLQAAGDGTAKSRMVTLKIHPTDKQAQGAFEDEVACLKALGGGSPWVVSLSEAFSFNSGEGELHVIALEPLCLRSLEKQVRHAPYSYTDLQAALWCTQIAKALVFLQEKGISHLDLTLRNVLLTNEARPQVASLLRASDNSHKEQSFA